nr:hypothetical protein [Tanacetum cinerariifolium]
MEMTAMILKVAKEDRQCAPRCNNYKKVGHLACDYGGLSAAANNQIALGVIQRVVTCFECGVQGNYKKDFPKLKNKNGGNQARKKEARARAYTVGNARTNPCLMSLWWKSRIKRYIDTKPNHELIHYCLKNPSYELGWIDKEIIISKGSPITRSERFQETYKNVSQEIRNQLNAEAEVVQIILTGIDNDIYSTVDVCPNTCEM